MNRNHVLLKTALRRAFNESGWSMGALARCMGVCENEVRRMLRTDHPTKFPRMEQALALFGKRVVITIEDA